MRHGRSTSTLALTASTLALALAGGRAAQAEEPAPFAPPAAAERVLYSDVTLIDGTGAPVRAGWDVLTEGERIRAVGRHGSIDPQLVATARINDLHGRFLIPGLVDSHVHLATPPNRRQAEAVLRRDLYGGVTAVRDMADDLRAVGELTRESLVGEIPAPDIYYAALMAGPGFFTDARSIQVSVGGKPGQVPWMQAVTDATDVPLAVAEARGTYATAIKLYADLTPTLAARITAEAHRQHLLVWAHATLYPAKPSEVVSAGADAISHACLLVREPSATVPAWGAPKPPASLDAVRHGDNPALAALFAEMKRRGTILDATVWTYSPATPTGGSTPPLPPGSCDDTVGGAITSQAVRAGVQVSAGTDNVAPWDDPWPDLFHELAALHDKAGLSPAAILNAATAISARAAGQSADMGAIAPGKLANMVILDRNPLETIENLKSVEMTVKRGRAFNRSDFKPLEQGDITDF